MYKRQDPQAPLAALASVWSLTYLWRLLPPVVAAASVLQRVLPVDTTQARLALAEDLSLIHI